MKFLWKISLISLFTLFSFSSNSEAQAETPAAADAAKAGATPPPVGAIAALGAISMVTSMSDSAIAQKVGSAINVGIGVKYMKACSSSNPWACVTGAAYLASAALLLKESKNTKKKKCKDYGCGEENNNDDDDPPNNNDPPDNDDDDPPNDDDPSCVEDDEGPGCNPDDTGGNPFLCENPHGVGCREWAEIETHCERVGCDVSKFPIVKLPDGTRIDARKVKPNPMDEKDKKKIKAKAIRYAKTSYPNLFSTPSSPTTKGFSGGTEEGTTIEEQEGYFGDRGVASSPIVIRRDKSGSSVGANNWYKKLQKQLNAKKKKRKNKGLKFQFKKLGNDKIGTSHDNIFDMVSEGYQVRY